MRRMAHLVLSIQLVVVFQKLLGGSFDLFGLFGGLLFLDMIDINVVIEHWLLVVVLQRLA